MATTAGDDWGAGTKVSGRERRFLETATADRRTHGASATCLTCSSEYECLRVL